MNVSDNSGIITGLNRKIIKSSAKLRFLYKMH